MQVEKRQRINKVILQEFQDTNFQSFSDDQITIVFPREDDLRQVEIVLTPTEGPYAGAKFEFSLLLPLDYPQQPATVTCTTQIMHPNISPESGKVCFNVFSDEWDSCMRLVDYAHALLWLLYQPNLDSRLNSHCPHHRETFEQQVKKLVELQRKRLQRTRLHSELPQQSVSQLVDHFNSLINDQADELARAGPVITSPGQWFSPLPS